MDRVDRQIIHCLQRHGRASFKLLAAVIEVSEQTIARRFRALQEAGAVRVIVLPDARVAGYDSWFARILCRPNGADALAEALAARDDVSWVSLSSGGAELTCAIRSHAQIDGGSVLLERLPKTSQVLSFAAYAVLRMYVGGENEWMALEDPLTSEQLTVLDAPLPKRGVASSGIREQDGPLLAKLADNGRASIATLSASTGWSAARIASRLEELFDSGAIYADLELAPACFGFNAIAYLWLTVAPGDLAATGEALALHPETSFAAAVTGSANLMTAVACRDSSALYSYVTTRVGALPAIRQAEIVPTLRRVKQAGTMVRGGRLVYSLSER